MSEAVIKTKKVIDFGFAQVAPRLQKLEAKVGTRMCVLNIFVCVCYVYMYACVSLGNSYVYILKLYDCQFVCVKSDSVESIRYNTHTHTHTKMTC